MKLRFKKQAYQTAAVEAIVDCFEGQPPAVPLSYRIDPGRLRRGEQEAFELPGFRNAEIAIPLLDNIRKVQRRQNLPESAALDHYYERDRSGKLKRKPQAYDPGAAMNLDIEMETGTGKTYCYIKTIFELHRRYGWSKFIIVVPSIAIREGVAKSFQITAEHFLEEYHKQVRPFIYNSKRLHELESYSSDAGINVMIINVQAFNATGKDARRIYEELDDFQSRRPIDVISANRPILILDEPQKMEGKKTLDALKQFNPLMILRYSATHRTHHNRVYRLDALDAFQQKLVKKIAVRGISTRGFTGTSSYMFLDSIVISPTKPPEARLEIEVKQASGIKRVIKRVSRNANLFDLSGQLDQYKGFVVADIDFRTDTVSFANGQEIQAGEATGDVSEETLRRIQIREAIKAHLQKEERLFDQGIKTLTLFFIDEVKKYRQYDDTGEQPGEYATIFEEEYQKQLAEAETLFNAEYIRYLKGIDASQTHNGYFSIDKKKRMVDPSVAKRGEFAGESDDSDAYDLILKDKERLLSFEEPTRFIFSHSALREGWDNPNVFVICTLKHSDNTVSRRQEVGRGMRLSVYSRGAQLGERADDPATVHDINVLTVVASESYKDFVKGLQKDISESLSERPRQANADYFTGKLIQTEGGRIEVTPRMAKQIEHYLIKHDYTDADERITPEYHEAKDEGELAELPDELRLYRDGVFQLIDSVFSDGQIPAPDNERGTRTNPLNLKNFEREEFRELWNRINQKAAYTVHFDSAELVRKCIAAINKELKVTPLQYTVHRGEQREETTLKDLQEGKGFDLDETETLAHRETVHSGVKYDLIGKVAEHTDLTRRSVAEILTGIGADAFAQYRMNPEGFITEASRLIDEQKATVIIEHLSYDPIQESYDIDIFTQKKPQGSFKKAYDAKRHIYEYVFTDSATERKFVEELDSSAEVVVYAKLPRGFLIPTPVGNYNPDWAVAFEKDKVRHVFFIAETKGSMSTMDLREIEKRKIDCARKFFADISSGQVRYDVVDSYAKLMDLVCDGGTATTA
jgi:type III restriction enzyme